MYMYAVFIYFFISIFDSDKYISVHIHTNVCKKSYM